MRKLNGFILAALMFFTAACSKEDTSVKGNGEGEVGYANITLSYGKRSYSIDEGDPNPGSEEENKVSLVEIYIFNEEDGSRESINNGYIKIEGWSASKSYVIPVTQGDKVFIVVASANPALGELPGKELSDMYDLINSYELNNTNSRLIPPSYIPMAGEASVTVGSDEHGVPVTIDIDRAFSKLKPLKTATTVAVNIPTSDLEDIFGTPVTSTDVTFDLVEYYVVNGISKSYTLPKYTASTERDVWTGWDLNNTLGNYYKSTYVNKEPTAVYSGATNGNVWIKRADNEEIFIHENSPKETVGPITNLAGYDRRTVCAMILKGKLTHTTEGDKIRYWRLNIASDYAYKLFRNVEYTLTLESVRTKGYETPEEAEEDEEEGEVIPKEGASVSANINIRAWRTIGLGQGV